MTSADLSAAAALSFSMLLSASLSRLLVTCVLDVLLYDVSRISQQIQRSVVYCPVIGQQAGAFRSRLIPYAYGKSVDDESVATQSVHSERRESVPSVEYQT